VKLINPGSSGEYGWHSLETVLVCPRRAALSRASLIRSESDALARGELMHIGLAHLYARRQEGKKDEYLSPLEAIDAFVQSEDANDYHIKWAERVKDAMRAYRAHWGPESHLRVEAVERVIRLNVQGKPYTQRLDLIVYDTHQDRYYIWDHKTTYAILNKVVRGYSLSGQMLGLQLMGRKAYGKKFGGVVLNFVKLTLSHEFEFGRSALELAPLAVVDLKKTILRAHRILEDEVIGRAPEDVTPVFTEACFGKYGACPGRAFCKGERNGG